MHFYQMENNCHYQTLYYDDKTGYVTRCAECENIQIGYGNLVITLKRIDFGCFKKWIANMKREHQGSAFKTLRNIIIPVPCEGMKFVLSFGELTEIKNMLESAENELSLELLQMFESN